MRVLQWLLLAAMVAIALACGGFVYDGVLLAGHVRRADGSPVAGVTVRISWPEDAWLGTGTTTTDADGRYGFWVGKPYLQHANNWRHVAVTPELAGFTFAPPTIDTILADDMHDADFTAEATAAATTLRILEVRWNDEQASVQVFEFTR